MRARVPLSPSDSARAERSAALFLGPANCVREGGDILETARARVETLGRHGSLGEAVLTHRLDPGSAEGRVLGIRTSSNNWRTSSRRLSEYSTTGRRKN